MSYLISLAAGLVVGLLYWAFKVQSPAPPLIALTGLLGMVIGEHAIPIVKAHFSASSAVRQIAAPPTHPVHLMAKEKFRKGRRQREL